MTLIAERVHKITIAEFDQFVEKISDASDYDLVDGEIVMMSNPTETHAQIAANIGAALKPQMDRRGCRTYLDSIRVQAGHDSNAHDKYKPDVVVRCGPVENRTYITDPVIVVEILSPSTFEHDRGRKLFFYKTLSTVQHVVLVYSDQMRVEHYRRTEDGWRIVVLTRAEQFLELEALAFEMTLGEIYYELPALSGAGSADSK